MMSAKTIANIWLDFESKAIPNVGTTQRAEMKRAFYAGVVSTLLMAVHTIDDGMEEERGVEILQAWLNECFAFFANVENKPKCT